MIAAYVRVSSKAQDCATQRHAIESRHIRIDDWFQDVVSSKAARPELQRLRKLVWGGRYTDLYVYKLDRLSRGTICEVMNLMTEFATHGCVVHTIADELPLEGPFREPMLAMLAWAANMERTMIAERVRAARERVEAAGGTWGRPPKVTRSQQMSIAALVQMGKSDNYIAQALKIPKGTLSRWTTRARRAQAKVA